MKRDPFQDVLDSMLKEVLRDASPPDLEDRVMRALQNQPLVSQDSDNISSQLERAGADPSNSGDSIAGDSSVGNSVGNGAAGIGAAGIGAAENEVAPPPFLDKLPLGDAALDRARSESDPQTASNDAKVSTAPAAHSDIVAKDRGTKSGSRDWMTPVFWMACGAASILILATVSIVVLQQLGQTGDGLSNATDEESTRDDAPRMIEREGFGNDRANDQYADSDTDGNSSFDGPPPFGTGNSSDSDGHAGHVFGHVDSLASQSDDEIVTFVNYRIDREITRQDVSRKPFVGDTEWHDRVFRVILGRTPRAEEIAEFEQHLLEHPTSGESSVNTSSDRDSVRAAFVDQLLSSDQYKRELSRRWGSLLANEWIGANARQRDRRVEQLSRFLTEAIRAEKSLDQVAYELITATGSELSTSDEFNPAASFLIARMDGQSRQNVTGDLSRVFLGRRLDCVQCHDQSFADDLARKDFWEFDAFLRQAQTVDAGEGNRRIINADFRGQVNDPDDAVIFYEDDDGVVRAAYPTFNGEQITTQGNLEDVDRRHELAIRMVSSDDFRQVMVNRVWAHVFGVGLTRPVDEFGSHNPVSHPELLSDLSDQFGAHGFQLRPLLKWMVLSEPFRREVAVPWDLTMDSPHLGRRPLFSRYYPTWDRPALASDALASVMDQRLAIENFVPGFSGLLANMHGVDVDDGSPNSNEPKLDANLAQAFLLREKTNPWGVSPRFAAILERVATSDLELDAKIEHLFLIAVARRPSSNELRRAHEMIQFRVEQSEDEGTQIGLQDVWWTLTLSAEFDR